MCHCHCRKNKLITKTLKGYLMKKIITILFVISALTTTFANSWSNLSTITQYTMETADDGNTYFRIYMDDFSTNTAPYPTIKWFGFIVNDIYKQDMADKIIDAKNAQKRIKIRYNQYGYLNYTTFGTSYNNQIHLMCGFEVQ